MQTIVIPYEIYDWAKVPELYKFYTLLDNLSSLYKLGLQCAMRSRSNSAV